MTGFSDYSTPKVQEKFSLINDFLTSSGLFIEQLYSGLHFKRRNGTILTGLRFFDSNIKI
jgi:hypothetical protein